MISRLFIVALILMTPASLFAQRTMNVTVAKERALAAQELDAVIVEARNLNDKPAIINIKSRAATLVSFSDQAWSESLFLELWRYVNDEADPGFDKQQARLVILRRLFPRNPKLARQLLEEQAKGLKDSSDQRLTGKLASQLVDMDPSAAASLLEQSIPISANPIAGIGALIHLREKDPVLADYVAAKVLDGLVAQPTLASLSGITLLTAYVFPGSDAPISSIEAESSLESLQFKYFLAGYDVLTASLKETNEALLKDHHYSQRDLQFRAAYQGQLAAILAALAPRVQPSLAVELANIAGKLAPQVPANISQITRPALARIGGNKLASDDPEQSFFFALSNGEFDEAEKQLIGLKDDHKKDIYTQLLNRNHAKALLAKSDVMGALTLIRKIEDRGIRLVMYLEAIKATQKKRDPDLATIIINEARLLIPQTDRNGLHTRALLSLSTAVADSGTIDDAFDFLSNAVTSINALAKSPKSESTLTTPAEAAMAELNDPHSLLDSPEMEQAFSSFGLRDLDRGLAQARRIELRPVQLAARLETIQGIINRSSKAKAIPKSGSD